MRLLAVALIALIALIQYPLWLGRGGWLRVWEQERQLVAQEQANRRAVDRNAALEGEVRDLRDGLVAIEERARYELGMVRPDEVFVQIYPTAGKQPLAPAQPTSEQPLRSAKLDARAAVRKAAFTAAPRQAAR